MENISPRYLWIIKFTEPEDSSVALLNPKSAELVIPSPPGINENLQYKDRALEKDAYDFLAFIQNLCEEIHKECVKRETESKSESQSEETKKNTEKVNKNLKNLENILNRFNEIMKRLNKPPPGPQ